MNNSTHYKTRQKAQLLNYMKSRRFTHVTVGEILRHFQENGVSMSAATVYRNIENMVDQGIVKKYTVDGMSGACFEYTGDSECESSECFHFKCEKCGELRHFHCKELSDTQKHMLKDHGFAMNSLRTVFYGKCEICSKQ